jgi:hypothetical protein
MSMNDPSPTRREPVDARSAHLTEWTFEEILEGTLARAEMAEAQRHLEVCERCAAELAAHRELFEALSGLPRFAPSPAFGDAVMARVRVAPKAVQAYWVERWIPTTRRGWGLLAAALVAPALPVVALVAWVLSQPLVTTVSLWQWTTLQTQAGAQTLFTYLVEWGMGSGMLDWAQAVYGLALGVPLGTLGAVLAVLAVAIPLSAWSLVRLARTPMETVDYAN